MFYGFFMSLFQGIDILAVNETKLDSTIEDRQRGRVGRATDLKSGDSECKSCSEH